jgi:uncharacterized protein YehS (DUF1456 family)
MSRNNMNFKRICAALGLRRNDVHEILNGSVSKSQVDGWMRNEDSRKSASGNSNAETVSRYRPMSDDNFDAFCEGLIDWYKKYEE